MNQTTPSDIQATDTTDLDRLTHPDDTIPTEDKLTFADLGLAKPILDALTKAGYSHPTPIQAGAIPPSLAGRDLLLSAQTGSGKTAAFVLPILHRLANTAKLADKKQKPAIKAVILTPTRELALQVQNSVRTYGEKVRGVFSVPLVGGSDYRGQIRALTKGVQIIVATPGRFIDHMNSGRIDLSELDVLVLDEADRMLDMGFSEDIDTILNATPENRQTIMSSATWDGAVGKIAESFTKNPERIAIKVESAHIDESVYFCDDFSHKNNLLKSLLGTGDISQAVIFTATKMSTERLAEDLCAEGYTARYLHGDLPQGKRNRIVSDVKAGKCQFLIATDVAARGIDIATISHVINYDLPRQAEDYVHRIGRSGRAGRTGQAISLCSMDDRHLLFAINRYLNRKMRIETIEGLEPRRDFNERPKAPKGKDKKRRGGRTNSRFDRAEREFERSYADKPKFDRTERGGRGERTFDKPFKKSEKGFDNSEKSFGKSFDKSFDKSEKSFNKPFEKRFEKSSDKGFKKPFGENKPDFKNKGKKSFDNDRFASAKAFDEKPFAPKFAKKGEEKRSFDKGSKFDKKESRYGRFDDKAPKRSRKSSVEEVVFHQTASKRRFGDRD